MARKIRENYGQPYEYQRPARHIEQIEHEFNIVEGIGTEEMFGDITEGDLSVAIECLSIIMESCDIVHAFAARERARMLKKRQEF